MFDLCDGHPQEQGVYHYHKIPGCIYDGSRMQLLGVALDGHPIFGPIDENGNELYTADLDECHGRIIEDGRIMFKIHTKDL